MATAAGDHSCSAPAGWFGKIPALGDFVARRLPPHFIEAWDHWLSTEILAARQMLGSDWEATYLEAPTWRFALSPGVIDKSHWYGVLSPSVDRVGRRFPLTLAASSEGAAWETDGWWAALISAAIRARAADCDADVLDTMLAGTLEPQPGRPVRQGDERAPTMALEGALTGETLWGRWQPESGRFGPTTAFRGLPQGPDFLRLIAP